MYTQQELVENRKIYETFKEKRIVFSNENTRAVGLLQSETKVKIGMEAAKGALISATMDDVVILARIDKDAQNQLYKSNGLITIQLKFYDSLFKKSHVFNLLTKLVDMNNNGLNYENMYYLNLKMRRKIPDDLVKVFGHHHIKSEKSKVSTNTEGMLFIRGVKKVCTPVSINDESMTIVFKGNPSGFLDQKGMVVLKVDGFEEVFELIGKISSDFDLVDDSYHLKLDYTPSQQSPRFSQSLLLLKQIINS